MRHAGKAAAGLAAALGLWGCSPDAGPVPVTTADSAGIQVVTHGPASLDGLEVWTLSPEPVVEVGGGADPEVALHRVTAVTPLAGGRVAIGMTAPPRVVVVSADGALATTLGGQGDGPGEFMGVASIVRIEPDSLAVWDAERRRISVFTEDGVFHRELALGDRAPLSWIASPDARSMSGRTDLLPSGPRRFVLLAAGVFGPGEGIRRVALPSFGVSADDGWLDSLGAFPGDAMYSSPQTGVVPLPLGPTLHGATAGDHLVVGTAEHAEYRRYGPEGRLVQIVRWAESDTLLGAEHTEPWDTHAAEWLDGMPTQEAASMRDLLALIPVPTRRPAYTGLVSSDQGETWVGDYHPGQHQVVTAYMGPVRLPERRWRIFADDGALRATVRTPDGFRPVTVRDGRVWGVHTDELDVESVRAYRVERGG